MSEKRKKLPEKPKAENKTLFVFKKNRLLTDECEQSAEKAENCFCILNNNFEHLFSPLKENCFFVRYTTFVVSVVIIISFDCDQIMNKRKFGNIFYSFCSTNFTGRFCVF